jgi:pimeloyl-ACP methyl ester carboxylesterase
MGRKILLTFGAILVALALVIAFGPRVQTDTKVTFDPATLGNDPDARLAAEEARFDDVLDGLQKEIVWADPATKARTPISLVYVHGFSASRGETAPLTEMIADELGANVFYARLAGHGRDEAAMAEASVNDWVNDMAEALAIGRMIGDEVVILSMSTGATLTAWAAVERPDLMERVNGIVMMSPNFQVKSSGSWMMTMPWGAQILRLVVGPERGFQPANETQARFWTEHYPVEALLPMAALVKHVRGSDFEAARVPALFIFSEADRVVDHSTTRDIADRWGAQHEVEIIPEKPGTDNHVIVGNALRPDNNEPFAALITGWIRALP